METIFLIIILSLIIAGFAAVFLLLQNRLKTQKTDEQALLMLQNQKSPLNF
jgi:NhaP-type Na+/H+ or K+/H+ antiporter